MNKNIIYLVAGIAIILFVMPMIIQAGRLDDPRTNRDCYNENLPFYVCVIQGTNIMEASFLTYEPMHDYYTPQLKEINWAVGNQAVSGKRVTQVKIGNTVQTVGNIAYSYVKKV